MSKDVLAESSFYQVVQRIGAIRYARQTILRLGRLKFGEPDAATVARVEAIDALDKLDQLSERLMLVNSWPELLEGA